MTQGPGNRSYSTHKRSNRGGRNKPTLVTTPVSENTEMAGEQAAEDTPSPVEESAAAEQVQASPAPPAPSSRRLPRFFSHVGKSSQAQEVDETEAAQARLARATRSKTTPAKAAASETTTEDESRQEQKATTRKEPARAGAPSRPASQSAFKTKYIIGMGIYLIGAQLIGTYEHNFFVANHLDSLLAKFSVFGLPMVIYTSTLVFLLTLIVLLVILARLDLIPRSFGALAGQPPQQNRRGGSNRQNSSDTGRTQQPTMRQGVKGADDDLYQQYRANQRKGRKK